MATYIKVDGTWRVVSNDTDSTCGYINTSTGWKTVSNSWVNVSGTWRSVCAPIPSVTPSVTPSVGGGGGDPVQDSSVSSLNPSSGLATGGYTVTLNGSFPSNITNIGFSHQGANASSFTRVSSSQYTFTMPSGTAGTTTQVQAFNGRTPVMSTLTFTFNSVPVSVGGGVVDTTCYNGSTCNTITYGDGSVVVIGAVNGTFNGSLRTEACGTNGTRTQAYTCITPAYCPNIPVAAGTCNEAVVSNPCVNQYGTSAKLTGYHLCTQADVSAPSSCSTCTSVDACVLDQGSGASCTVSVAPSCSCSPLSTTAGTRSIMTYICSSGTMNTSISTYNSCCVSNGTVTSTTVVSDTGCYTAPVETCGACGAQNNIPPDVEYGICNGVQACIRTTTYQRKYCPYTGSYSYDCTPVVTYSSCSNSTSCGYVAPTPTPTTYCPSLGFAVPSSGFPGNCPGASGNPEGGTPTPTCNCNYSGAGYCVGGVTYAPECCAGTGCCTQGPACGSVSPTPTPTPVTPEPTPTPTCSPNAGQGCGRYGNGTINCAGSCVGDRCC